MSRGEFNSGLNQSLQNLSFSAASPVVAALPAYSTAALMST